MTAAQAAALLRSFRQALDESEVRQQQNLQLRIGEVTRDFDLQRRQDLVAGRAGLRPCSRRSASRCSDADPASSRWEFRSSDCRRPAAGT